MSSGILKSFKLVENKAKIRLDIGSVENYVILFPDDYMRDALRL